MNEDVGRELWLAMDINDIAVQQQLEYYQSQAKKYYNINEGKWESPSSFHITIEYIAKNEKNYQKVIDALKEFETNITIPKTTLYGYNFYNFDQKADNHVLYIGVDNAWYLYQIKYAIVEYLKRHGITPPNDYPTYTPHITMAYDVKNVPDITTPKIEIPLNNITLWNSFKVNNVYNENILYKIDL